MAKRNRLTGLAGSGKLALAVALAMPGAATLAGCAPIPAASEAPVAPVATAQLTGEAQIADLVSRMTLEHKIAQLIQPQLSERREWRPLWRGIRPRQRVAAPRR